ncbi:MAG: hypothetical protein ISR82_08565 [Candidatus Marinimicrobia bacterium]|nr:hypothetical protein [Candidatus Neomarinimicrobiota bacterium]MBL7011260.1 hypothetical protein [Candidatus Neomarinimicrobiota bacterium]
MIRNIIAVPAGWLIWGILCNAILIPILMSVFPNQFENMIPVTTGMLISTLFLTFICSFATGFITAFIAASHHRKVVLAAGILNLLFGTYIQIMSWATLPPWYHIIFLVSLVPLIYLGGMERIKRL